MANDQLFSLQTYTPNSDIAAGFQPGQIIWSRSGNDTLLGLQPNQAIPGQKQVDTFIGDLALDDPKYRQWSDTFILGDAKQSYYANGNPFSLGLNDFGLIVDFNPNQDFIQLHGTANDYQLVNFGFGQVLLQQKDTGLDTIGVILGNSGLSLEGNYFQYKNNTSLIQPNGSKIQQLGSSGYDLASTTATDSKGNVYIAGGTTGTLGAANNGDSRDALIAKYDSVGNLLWTKQFGTSSADTIYSIATDKEGNFYVAGFTEGNLAKQKQAEVSDAWLAKYDSNGNQIWIQQFGEASITQAFSIDVDKNGNVYVSGITVKPAPEIATDDLWVTKYDTNGNRQWFKEFGSSAFDESYAVTVSNDGSVYAAGWSLGNLAAENAGVYDAALVKLDNNGQVEWAKQFGTTDYEWIWGVDTDSQGNVYTTGWTLSDLGGKNAGSYDVFLAKFDAQGNQVWMKQFGTAGDDQAFRLNIDSNDNIFLTGYTNDSLGGTNAGSYDAWVAKYDTNGNQGWITQLGTSELDHGLSLSSDNNGHVYVTGVTGGSFGATNAGSFDTWLAKLDAQSGALENFSGTPKSTTVSPPLESLLNTKSGYLENFSGTPKSTIAFPRLKFLLNAKLGDLENFSGTPKSTIAFPRLKSFLNEADNSPLNQQRTHTSNSHLSNQQITEFVDNFFQGFLQDNNLQFFAGISNETLDNEALNQLISAIYGNNSIGNNNTIYGNCGDDTLYGGNDNDTIYGKSGNDVIYGGEGNNKLYGDDGNDTLYGGAGNDTIDGGEGSNLIYAGEGKNTVIAGSCHDQIYTGASDDIINAGNGNNLIYAGEGKNTITTGVGNDTIYVGADDDFIYADAGDDLIYAGEGNNVIYGGSGNNTIYSGSGNDLFVCNPGEGSNTIMNFQIDQDLLWVTGGITFDQLSITQSSNCKGVFTQISVADSNDILATLNWVDANSITSSSFAFS